MDAREVFARKIGTQKIIAHKIARVGCSKLSLTLDMLRRATVSVLCLKNRHLPNRCYHCWHFGGPKFSTCKLLARTLLGLADWNIIDYGVKEALG